MNTSFKSGDGPIGLSVSQLQQNLPISRTSIYRLIKEGKLKTVVVCGRRIIPRSEVNRLMSFDCSLTEADWPQESN